VEFDRLNSTDLSLRGTGLDLMVDFGSGRMGHDCQLFVKFVKECVWSRLCGDKKYAEAIDEENGL
jgi:hypothetical protein